MQDEKFQMDLENVKNALSDEHGRVVLKESLTPFVYSTAEEYIRDSSFSDIPKEKIITAGWTHFDLALKNYLNRSHSILDGETKVIYFKDYFNWYIRQGIVEYLKSLKDGSDKEEK